MQIIAICHPEMLGSLSKRLPNNVNTFIVANAVTTSGVDETVLNTSTSLASCELLQNQLDKQLRYAICDLTTNATFELSKRSHPKTIPALVEVLAHYTLSRTPSDHAFYGRIWQTQIFDTLIDTIKQKNEPCIGVLILDDEVVAKQISYWFSTRRDFKLKVLMPRNFHKATLSWIKRVLPIGPFAGLARTWFARRYALTFSRFPNLTNRKAFASTLFLSIVPQTLSPVKHSQSRYNDYFFGQSWQSASEPSTLIADALGATKQNTAALAAYFEKQTETLVILQAFLRVSDLLFALAIALKLWLFPFCLTNTASHSAERFVSLSLQNDARDSGVYANICQYLAIRNLLGHTSRKQTIKLVFPHEGRALERMTELAAASFDNVILRGYMHYPLSDKHLAMIYTDVDKAVLKNQFMTRTIGQENRSFLCSRNRWPEAMVSICGALKQGATLTALATNDPSLKKETVLVLLSMDNDANKRLLSIVLPALKISEQQFHWQIRLHPSLRARFSHLNKYLDNSATLAEAFLHAKMIVYGETGAAVEALAAAVPLIYIPDCPFLLSDRLANFTEMKFCAQTSEELLLELADRDLISPETQHLYQKLSIEALQRYLQLPQKSDATHYF